MKKLRNQSGQSLFEFALIIPTFLILVIGFTDLGRVIYFYSAVNNAVREAARYASVTQFSDETERDLEIQQKVVQFSIATPVNLSDITLFCDLNEDDQDNPCDDHITVKATFSFEPIIPIFSEILGLGGEFTITTESTMQMTPYGKYHE
jgi:Flp pilus assembly protein TadG